MDIAALAAELTAGHPVTGAYNADAVLAAAQGNAEDMTANKSSMTATEVYNAIDSTQWLALTDAQRQEIWDILHLGTINPFGLEATRFIAIFGAGTATITALAAARKSPTSQFRILGFGDVKAGDIQRARA